MASLYTRKNSQYIWIKWYNSQIKDYEYESTKFTDTKDGWKKAKELLKEVNARIVIDKINIAQQPFEHKAEKTIKECYEHFKIQLSNKSKTTQDEYSRFYNRFITFFPENLGCSIIQREEIEKFLSHIKLIPKIQQNTKHGLYKNTKKFLNFLFDYNYIPLFRISRDFYIKPEVKNILTFPFEDIEKIFSALSEKSTNFQTMIYILLYTGLRPSDIKDIESGDINFASHTLQYYSPKTDEWITVSLHPELLPILHKRIKEIGSGKLLEYSNIKNMGKAFRRFAKDQGLNKHYNLRTFRKTFISLSYDMGVDIATVSKLVGHHNIATTQKYYNKLSLHNQKNALNKFSLDKIVTEVRDSKEKDKKKTL